MGTSDKTVELITLEVCCDSYSGPGHLSLYPSQYSYQSQSVSRS